MLFRQLAWRVSLLLLALSACAPLEVKTEHEPSADFSSYKTFAFADPSDIGEERTPQEVLLRDRIEPAISSALTGKGLRQLAKGQHPDLAVYYWVETKTTQRKAWRTGYAQGAVYRGAVVTYPEREGTLILDLVEPVKNRLVWRATISSPLKETKKENLDLAIKAVTQALGTYPP
jgi:hypothetical protein